MAAAVLSATLALPAVRASAALPDFDSRSRAAPAQASAAQASLARRLGSEGLVQVDPTTRTPRVVARLDGFLTGPGTGPPAGIALSYVRSHLPAFGLTARDLAQLHLTKDYVDILGTHHLVWEQRVGGIPMFDNGLRANVTKDGRLINVLGSPIHRLAPRRLRPAGPAPGRAELVLFGNGGRGGATLAW
jgi:extracellular elastinolytic metalloproteinase